VFGIHVTSRASIIIVTRISKQKVEIKKQDTKTTEYNMFAQ